MEPNKKSNEECLIEAYRGLIETYTNVEADTNEQRSGGIEESILSGEGLSGEGCVPSGYVVDSLKCSLRCFIGSRSFEESILLAANLGGDSDTIAAICGQLDGAYYGMSGIPSGRMDILYHRDHIIDRADRLYNKR